MCQTWTMDWSRDGSLIALFVLLFLIAVVLAAAETALVRVSRVRIAAIADEGGRRAKRTLQLLDDLPHVLNTILLVVLLVQIGAATVTGILAERWFGSTGVTLSSFVLTIFLFVLTRLDFSPRRCDRSLRFSSSSPICMPPVGVLPLRRPSLRGSYAAWHRQPLPKGRSPTPTSTSSKAPFVLAIG